MQTFVISELVTAQDSKVSFSVSQVQARKQEASRSSSAARPRRTLLPGCGSCKIEPTANAYIARAAFSWTEYSVSFITE